MGVNEGPPKLPMDFVTGQWCEHCIQSMPHQNEGGIGKSNPNAQEILSTDILFITKRIDPYKSYPSL